MACFSRRCALAAACLALLGSGAGRGQEPLPDAPRVSQAAPEEERAPGSSESGEAARPPNPYAGGPFDRATLSGDWWGARSRLDERGLKFDVHSTQFYQGVAAGGQQRTWQYGGKLDYLFNLDGRKLGVWEGFFLNLHAETRYGEDTNNVDGLIAPSNIVMAFPEPNTSITSITGLKLTQALSENFALFAGKVNTIDEYAVHYDPALVGLPGRGGFQNTSLVFNPIVARTLPYAAAGAGFAVLKDAEPVFTFSVLDPEERAARDLSGLYDRGVVLVPDLILRPKILGRPGVYNFGGTWSSAKYRSFDPAAYLQIPATLVRDDRFTPQETGSWSLYANFFQALWVDPDDEKRGWGVFGQFGISDGNPNPIRFVANGGVGGRSMIPGRKRDTFGIGYFYLGLSNNFKALAGAFLPQQDEYGVELFYNLAVAPWARLTYDFQVARPSTAGLDTAIITGLRFQLFF